MRKNLLIIFYRNPELGKVKTRLAATLGDANALAVYLKLVNHTKGITSQIDVDKIVYYSNYVDKEDNWPNAIYDKQLQIGETLGEKLTNAIKSNFEKGYDSICVIGSDCFELTSAILQNAFVAMESCDGVIGPAKDGGYYLLGTRKFIQDLFNGKKWSTNTVAEDTINDFVRLGITYHTLPLLTDVDREEDLPIEILSRLER